jgi:hypothetical protein
VQPGDLQFNELALQSSFIGTQLPLDAGKSFVLTRFQAGQRALVGDK